MMEEDKGGGTPKDTGQRIAQNSYNIKTYDYGDASPYIVIIQSPDDKDIINLHPIKLGRKLQTASVGGIIKITKKGRNRLGVEFGSPKSANEFIGSEFVKQEKLQVFIPNSLVTCRGVVRGIPEDMTPIEILESANAEGKVISARRINRRVVEAEGVKYVPTQSVVLTFRGKRIPQHVTFSYYRAGVNVYVSPVVQCKNCLRYGHFEALCRSKVRCRKCTGDHEEEKCDSLRFVCAYCEGEHSTLDRQNCPEFARQKAIKEIMAFDNVSYFEARAKCPKMYETTKNSKDTPPTHSGWLRNPNDFPNSLKVKESQFINISERRAEMQKSSLTHKPSYQYITKVGKRKPDKNTLSPPPVSSKMHREATFPSSARIATSSPLSFNLEREGDESIPLLVRMWSKYSERPGILDLVSKEASKIMEDFLAGIDAMEVDVGDPRPEESQEKIQIMSPLQSQKGSEEDEEY